MFEKDAHSFRRCNGCALERIDPAPSDDTLAAIYGKHYYDAWGLHRDEARVSRLKRGTFAYLLDQLPPNQRGDKLLDCGAATGFLMDVARDRGFDAYGIELSEFGANEIASKFGPSHVFQGEIAKAQFEGVSAGDFRVITMCDYIEHVRDPGQTLECAAKLIAKGGCLVITTPDTGSLTHTALRTGWSHYKIEHLYYFGQKNLTRLLARAGFGEVRFLPLLKSLDFSYLREQFEVYPHPVISPAFRVLDKVLPRRIQSQPLRLRTGEMLAIATRT
jgi:2-polyprenyl-3-methyl-5-hydroxy-6-metoxy-1,4-benzoquinol methylase